MPQSAAPDTTITPQQQKALSALLAGESVTSAAKTARVNRTTVHRWLGGDQNFQAAWNRGRAELHDATQARLSHLATQAVSVLEDALGRDDIRTAIALLRGVGHLSGQRVEIGSDDPERIRRDREAEEKEQEYMDLLHGRVYP